MANQPHVPPPNAEVVAPADYAKLLAVVFLFGLPVTAACLGYVWLVDAGEELLWSTVPDLFGVDGYTSLWWAPLMLMVGAALVTAARKLPGSTGGPALEGLHFPVEPSDVTAVVVVAFASLTFGIILGPEMPLMALGSAAGLFLGRRLGLPDQSANVFALAGTFAAVATVFGHPMAAAVLLLELIAPRLGAKAVSALLPGLLAAGAGYLLFSGIDSWTGLESHPLQINGLPAYPTARLADLIAAAVLGLLVGGAGLLVRYLAARWLARDAGWGVTAHTFATAGLLSVLAVAFLLLTDEDISLFLFSGQSGLDELVAGPGTAALFLIVLFKLVGFTLCMGSHFRGGPIFPIVFIGAALGVGIAGLGPDLFSETPLVAAGVAAGMTAILRLPISGLMFALVLLGDTGLTSTTAAIFGSAGAYVALLIAEHRAAGASTVKVSSPKN